MVTGNWKMYKTGEEACQFLETLAPLLEESQVDVSLAVPYTAISLAAQKVAELNASIAIGAQNMNDASEGAFTGEVAARMLKSAGATFVILGHSERRHIFHETSDFINKKVKKALQEGLQPILCIGETGEERENGETEEILKTQLHESLQDLSKEEMKQIILAYEPVWAIGTGEVATPEMAEEAHLLCRELVASGWGKRVAKALLIQYGGSVKPENAADLLVQENINGLLVGGASLQPETFYEILQQYEGITV